jgi:hypothetical protein
MPGQGKAREKNTAEGGRIFLKIGEESHSPPVGRPTKADEKKFKKKGFRRMALTA